MDEMKIKVSTKIMKNLVSKILTKIIFKKFGIKPRLSINILETELRNNKLYFHIDIDGDVEDKVLLRVNSLIDDSN